MDHLSELIKGTFHDSSIAKAFSCKRTKAAAMTYNVLAKEFKNELRKDIQATGKHVSLIIDETTDKATVKCMAIVIKFFCEKLMKVDTRLLNLILVLDETAAGLFDALKTDLAKHGLELTNLVGFAADTTNVIFGGNNSIVSRIIEANPHCLTMKCACHSCALALSHATSALPRNLEQIVKESYNYFAFSSKRCNEFKEFQDFTESQQYRMLRFYSIRWLSFGFCVERILSQWEALKLFFTSQYLVDRLQASQFLYNQFSDPISKLYFTFLSYIIPVVNKLNIIFQCQSPAIHKLHSNCSLAYKAILSCFIRPVLLKGDVVLIDPENAANHLPLTQLYMGVEASRLLVSNSFKGVAKEKITECFQRCKQFLIALCVQLKMRLPLNNPVIQDLKFLDPQTAISGTIASISNVASRFPNIVPAKKLQCLDHEWRQLVFDEEISDLADSCATSPTDEFWAKVATNENYKVLGAFAKAMLCIPVSNADCERVFSQVNLIKTTHRNRFSTEGVASLIFAKDGVRHLSESCVQFQPSTEMVCACTKDIYTNVEAIYGDDPEETEETT